MLLVQPRKGWFMPKSEFRERFAQSKVVGSFSSRAGRRRRAVSSSSLVSVTVAQVRNCLFSWMTSSLLLSQSVWPFCTGWWVRFYGATHGSESTKGRRKYEIVQVCSPLVASNTVWRQGGKPVDQWWCGGANSRCRREPIPQDVLDNRPRVPWLLV